MTTLLPRLAAFVLAAALAGLALPGISFAAVDASPPTLTALAVTPQTVDVGSGPVTVTAALTITDDLSGLLAGGIGYVSPSGTQRVAADVLGPPSGNAQYTTTLTLPRFAESGAWRVEFVSLHDNVNHSRTLTRTDLESLGLAPTITVSGTQDVTPPSLSSLTITPNVDVSAGPAAVTITATATDNLSGVGTGSLSLNVDTTVFKHMSIQATLEPAGGDLYTATVTMPRYAQSGTWQITSMWLKDRAGNTLYLSTNSLRASGFDSGVVVTGEQDIAPPTITSLSVTPTAVDIGSSAATATLTASITDDRSDISYAFVAFVSPSGLTTMGDPYFHRVSGDQWQATLTFPRYTEPGIWHVNQIVLIDGAMNFRLFARSDVQALGFDPVVTVSEADTVPPVLIVPADFAVDATSPNGAVVTFTVTATDNSGSTPVVTCKPVSGSQLGIGVTTVQCTATDAAGNVTNGSLAVHVRSAAEQLVLLRQRLASVSLRPSIASGLDTALRLASAQLAQGRPKLASLTLGVFAATVRVLPAPVIAPADASGLVTAANRIRAVLG